MTDPAVWKTAVDTALAALRYLKRLVQRKKDMTKVSTAIREMLSLRPNDAIVESALEGVQDKTTSEYFRAKAVREASRKKARKTGRIPAKKATKKGAKKAKAGAAKMAAKRSVARSRKK